MQKLEIKRLAGAGVLSLGLVVGVAGFAGASSGTIGNTGYQSLNEINHESSTNVGVNNDNNVDLLNENLQRAYSGDAVVELTANGGNAMTGSASNANMVAGTVEIDNSHAAAAVSGATGATAGSNDGSVWNTGANSQNQVNFEHSTNVGVTNTNDVSIENSNYQSARSGDAEVRYNVNGGSATTGNVSNTSSSTFTVRVTN
jgi:hypothetical protein